MGANSAQFSQHCICLQESAQRRMIMTALQIIQTDGVIVHIVTITEGIVFAQIILAAAGDRNNLAPGIVLIPYYLRMPACQNANDVALKIVLVEETRVIEVRVRRLAVRIIRRSESISFGIGFAALRIRKFCHIIPVGT